MEPIKADFDGILPLFDILGPYRRILMAFAPFLLMGPIKADFDDILPRFVKAQMAEFYGISPLFPFCAHFDGISPFDWRGSFKQGPKGRDYILVYVIYVCIFIYPARHN